MKSSDQPELVISGIGVTTSIGQGKSEFSRALLNGEHQFGVIQRPGRQCLDGLAESLIDEGSHFIGAEVKELILPESINSAQLRTVSFSGQVALATLHQAWHDARLSDVEPSRIGLYIGGSNFQQRDLTLTHNKYSSKPQFLRPTYAMSFMDTDVCGICTETFPIGGFACTLGGASASGQLAVIQAIQSVLSGQVDVCIAMGALMDLSFWELQGFRTIGAMGSQRFATQPALAARPFDQDRDGFIYGESCGAVVIEKSTVHLRRYTEPYAVISGWATALDGNRNANPSMDGEVSVIQNALKHANLLPTQIDYINPHGTGSIIGDVTELKAIQHCGIDKARINTTKSILGHGLCAAGIVEIIASLVQMKSKTLHPSRNLDGPIDIGLKWVGSEAETCDINNVINLSMGFGGINTALCLRSVK